jgi:uncharacterized coiled-coil protein SlyX
MNLSVVPQLLNTFLLVVLFFYQWNRNKVLLERIKHQHSVIEETKGIVIQQSTAIDSQGKVVDTAIKYTEAFSPQKLGDIIRREMAVEYAEERAKLEAAHAMQLSTLDGKNRELREASEKMMQVAIDAATDYVKPFVFSIVKHLVTQPRQVRELFLTDMDDGDAKTTIATLIAKVELHVGGATITETPDLVQSAGARNPMHSVGAAGQYAGKHAREQ